MEDHRAQCTELMDRASAGDAAAFGQLAKGMQDGLFRFAIAHGLPRADAAEAVQETLLRAYDNRRRWKTGSNASAWLYGIAMNVVRELWRKRRRAAPVDVDLDLLAGREAPRGPEADELAGLTAALAQLPARQLEAVACRYLRQMSVRETAAVMGCAEGTVKAAVFAALANLRKAMGAVR
jgi:RNA polymerase sigma-70 factor (ECF subfamily)